VIDPSLARFRRPPALPAGTVMHRAALVLGDEANTAEGAGAV
jgi:hypothetical protein